MSRIIVKNLPKQITAERLRSLFTQKGSITDLQLKYTKDGRFRQFAFIGFTTEEEAMEALKYFNNTFIDSSQLKVEICTNLGDSKKPRAWSKYSEESSSFQKSQRTNGKKHQEKEVKSLSSKSETKKLKPKILEELEHDAGFAEFVDLHKRADTKPIWSDDIHFATSESVGVDSLESKKQRKTCESNQKKENVDLKKQKKIVTPVLEKEHSDNESVLSESTENDSGVSDDDTVMEKKVHVEAETDEYVVKLSGLPYKCRKKNIKDFFRPLKCIRLRLPPKSSGFAYVQFRSEKDMKQALIKHHSILDGKKVSVVRYIRKSQQQLHSKEKWKQQKVDHKAQEEIIGDLGRLFIRNLSYTCKEEDIENLFKKYGPTTEVHLPMDSFTRKIKGFAYVSYMFPEHAIKALTDLDGSVFQGRVLHILPAEAKKEKEIPNSETVSFKDKKNSNLKESSNSSHNWNALFLGANAVADVMAEKYGTTKAHLLDTEKSSSIAVRVALGETQIVAETREFLENRGVCLDAFNQPAGERSKTVVIVKNLPKGVVQKELHEMFGRYGVIDDVILPPSGITALVVFQEAVEAKTAFKHLAYSKFYDSPLYLEWAPVNSVSNSFKLMQKEKKKKEEEADEKNAANRSEDEKSEEEAEEEPEPDGTIFVKNLNYETTEDDLKKHFEKCGKIHSVVISKKKDLKRPGNFLSMGYGFVYYLKKRGAKRALKELQHSDLDGHALELKISNKDSVNSAAIVRKKTKTTDQTGTKIMVRNIPFEATKHEVRELFAVFGELRAIRLPQKVAGTGKHRGFGFVDFLTKGDAKRAMKSLSQSTHLYGRRLVLEWADTDDTDVDNLRKKTADYFSLSGGPESKRVKKSAFFEHLESAVRTEED